MRDSPYCAFINAEMGGDLSKTEASGQDQAAHFPHLIFAEFVTSKLSPTVKSWWARNVRPSASVHDAGYRTSGYAKSRADFVLFDAVGDHLQELADFLLRQLFGLVRSAKVPLLKARSVSVIDVFRLRDPFKVFKPIVVLVAIDVVRDMLRGWRRSNERLKDHPVDADACLPRFWRGWGYGQVSPCRGKWLEKRAAANTASGTHFVVPLISGERHPYFVWFHDINIGECLRNYNGHTHFSAWRTHNP